MKRSDQLKHKPRGIIKWAPFNSLPEFTEKQREQRNEINELDNKVEYDEDREYYFNDLYDASGKELYEDR